MHERYLSDGYTPFIPNLHFAKGSSQEAGTIFKQDACPNGEELSSVPIHFHMKFLIVASKLNFFSYSRSERCMTQGMFRTNAG